MINAEVSKAGTENALSTIRKFSRKVQGTGLIKTVRAGRYYKRDQSKSVKKKQALKRLKRRDEYQQLLKEGKVTEAPRRGYAPRTQEAPARLGESTPIAR